MSRIGRLPIAVPEGVKVDLEGRKLTVTGPRGTLSRDLHPEMKLSRQNCTLLVERPSEQKVHRQLHGLTRTLVNNMVLGVTDGFRKGLEITGVGYRAVLVGQVAARVRSTRKPEPYKGKGVRYAGEKIRRKAGKAGKIGGKK